MDTLLELAKDYIPELNAREITIQALAIKLGCTADYLYHELTPLLKRRRASTETRRRAKNLSLARAQMRERKAYAFLQGQCTLEKAAKEAQCSSRTIYRHAQRLKHDALHGRKVVYTYDDEDEE